MRKGSKTSDIPSQTTVPQQDRFPVQSAADMDILTTAIPRQQINSNTDFPMPPEAQGGGSSIGSGSGPAMSYDSHTNGRLKDEK
jgi:hypothetical protein